MFETSMALTKHAVDPSSVPRKGEFYSDNLCALGNGCLRMIHRGPCPDRVGDACIAKGVQR